LQLLELALGLARVLGKIGKFGFPFPSDVAMDVLLESPQASREGLIKQQAGSRDHQCY